jgi:hypothetical protein
VLEGSCDISKQTKCLRQLPSAALIQAIFFGKSNLERSDFLVEMDYMNGKGWISPFSGEFVTL